MGVAIEVDNVIKKYGDHTVINGLSLAINPGEFFTLLGPSGCGKTTLLRMIIGFNSIEGGEIRVDGQVINNIPTNRRNMGMVFQNYAVFPHMNVRDNVAYGLKTRKVPRDERRKRANEMLEMVKISQFAERMPAQLSGGQQQRVALARAIVIQPDVLLMDEPLSNLDAKLRVEMRTVIKEIQNSVGITTVYVTHDQEEAMAVSDRIAVMNLGVIQQIGTPKALYQRPANLFVASFIGRTNILPGELRMQNGTPQLIFEGGYSVPMKNVLPAHQKDQKVQVSVRPEEFVLDPAGQGIRARIDDSVFLGLNTHYFVTTAAGVKAEIVQESQIDSILPKGMEVSLDVKQEKINVLTEDGEANILTGVQNDRAGA
ncbi:MAG: ABC transporter ATP-binding protein [Clostridiales bacterium]|nr:ABC transporter ATP-binding protein [Clostridiales bacterium]